MQNISGANFGILIAYILPGFLVLLGLSGLSENVQNWMAVTGEIATVSGLLYSTIATLACGMTVSTVRWALIDSLHHRTGIHEARWDFSQLGEKVSAYEVLIRNHYVYYKAHANMLVALGSAYFCHILAAGWRALLLLPLVLLLGAILWAGSRDALSKYYRRGEMLFGRTGCCHEVDSVSQRQPAVLSVQGESI